jgi:hypothetical protein
MLTEICVFIISDKDDKRTWNALNTNFVQNYNHNFTFSRRRV